MLVFSLRPAGYAAMLSATVLCAALTGCGDGGEAMPVLDVSQATFAELRDGGDACKKASDAYNNLKDMSDKGTDESDAETNLVREYSDDGLQALDQCPISVGGRNELTMFFRMTRGWSASVTGKDPNNDLHFLSNVYVNCVRTTTGDQHDICDKNVSTVSAMIDRLKEKSGE